MAGQDDWWAFISNLIRQGQEGSSQLQNQRDTLAFQKENAAASQASQSKRDALEAERLGFEKQRYVDEAAQRNLMLENLGLTNKKLKAGIPSDATAEAMDAATRAKASAEALQYGNPEYADLMMRELKGRVGEVEGRNEFQRITNEHTPVAFALNDALQNRQLENMPTGDESRAIRSTQLSGARLENQGRVLENQARRLHNERLPKLLDLDEASKVVANAKGEADAQSAMADYAQKMGANFNARKDIVDAAKSIYLQSMKPFYEAQGMQLTKDLVAAANDPARQEKIKNDYQSRTLTLTQTLLASLGHFGVDADAAAMNWSELHRKTQEIQRDSNLTAAQKEQAVMGLTQEHLIKSIDAINKSGGDKNSGDNDPLKGLLGAVPNNEEAKKPSETDEEYRRRHEAMQKAMASTTKYTAEASAAAETFKRSLSDADYAEIKRAYLAQHDEPFSEENFNRHLQQALEDSVAYYNDRGIGGDRSRDAISISDVASGAGANETFGWMKRGTLSEKAHQYAVSLAKGRK